MKARVNYCWLAIFCGWLSTLAFAEAEIEAEVESSEPCIDRPLPNAADATFIGVADDLENGEHQYWELHFATTEAAPHRVLYVASDGTLLAEKCIHYGDRPIQPSVHQFNHTNGEVIAINPQSAERLALGYRQSSDDRLKSDVVDKPTGLVVDAGFDEYVQQQWQALRQDGKQVFQYAVPSRLTVYPFTLANTQCAVPDDHACFQIAPKAWWLRMLVDPINLAYDDNKRLRRYRGLGNIGDADGDYLAVAIDYFYHGDAAFAEQINAASRPDPATR